VKDILGLRKVNFGNRLCFCDRFLCMCNMNVFGSSLPVEGYLVMSRSMP
jgi:hypothetical protein